MLVFVCTRNINLNIFRMSRKDWLSPDERQILIPLVITRVHLHVPPVKSDGGGG